MIHFKYFNKQDALNLTHVRRFETKIGERIHCIPDNSTLENALQQTACKYVLVGIPEDIGVKANHGIAGADSAWFPFLSSFLNIQSNDLFTGENTLLAGNFDFSELELLIESNAPTPSERIEALRHAVITVDDEVEQVVNLITHYKKIPILVGGGHNNAYPAIKGAAKGLHKAEMIPLSQINCINLDAHADYRPAEGRHSGNPFRYADEDGYLNKYFIVGIHENYMQQNVMTDILNSPFIDYITYEDIFLHEKKNFIQAVAHATGFTEDTYTGIEVDLDCVERVLSSASTPSGISVLNARQFINFVATDAKVAYLHICEGATRLNEFEDPSTGKLISYLVTDFIKKHSQQG